MRSCSGRMTPCPASVGSWPHLLLIPLAAAIPSGGPTPRTLRVVSQMTRSPIGAELPKALLHQSRLLGFRGRGRAAQGAALGGAPLGFWPGLGGCWCCGVGCSRDADGSVLAVRRTVFILADS